MTSIVSPSAANFGDRNAMDTFTVSSDGAGDVYVDLGPIIRRGMINIGILMQAQSGAPVPSFTLMNGSDVTKLVKAGNGSQVVWDARPALVAGAITSFFIGATFARLHFAAAGSVIIGSL